MTDNTDKKDGPGKAPDRAAADSGAAKRPFATIDLKATEVRGSDTKASAATAKPASTTATPTQVAAAERIVAAGAALGAAGAVAQAAPAKPQSAVPPVSGKSGQQQAAAAAGATSGKAVSPAPEAAARTAASPVTPAAPPHQGTSVGRFFTHLAAGIAGGLLALVGGQLLAPLLGLDGGRPATTATSGIAPDHAARLNVLEKQVRERLAAAPAVDAARTAPASEASLVKLDEVTKLVGTLSDAQAKLQAENAALREQVAKQASLVDAGDRLVKLEEQLQTMAAAAAADPQRAGRLPQLAQLTGQVADLETQLANRLTALRKDMAQDNEGRVAASIEAGEAAKVGIQRIDKEVAAVRSDTGRLGQRLDQAKTGSDKLEQSLKSLLEEAGNLKTALGGLKTDVDGRIGALARPADVAMAVAPVAAKVAAIETSVQNVMRAEEDRKSNAERIVLSLELGNLKRAMERGSKYAAELAEVRKVAGGRIDIAALERYQNEGVPTLAELQRTFRATANATIDADTEQPDASVVDRLLSGAKTVVRVRKTTHSPEDVSAEAIVGRMEAALKEARLGDVVSEAKKLSTKAARPVQDWLKKVEARQTVEGAIAAIDGQLKSSLGASGPASSPASGPASGQKEGKQ